MKQFSCELCGGNNLMKQDGVFVCQDCGCKYSLEEARKLMSDGTGEIACVAQTDNSAKYNNLMQLISDSFIDGRFDSAYNHCVEASAIMPGHPVLIALQGLAVLGKETNFTDIPPSCVSAFSRMFSAMDSYPVSIDEKVAMLQGVGNTLETVCKFKLQALGEETRLLNAQMTDYSQGRHAAAAATLMLEGIAGNAFTQHMAESDADKQEQKRRHNQAINAQLSKVYDREQKVRAFQKTYSARVDSEIRKLKKQAAKAKEQSRLAYWETHQDEKDELDRRIQELTARANAESAAMADILSKINAINRELQGVVTPSQKKVEELRNRIHDLERQRLELSRFKRREREKLDEQISSLRSQIPSWETIEKEKVELRKAHEPQLAALEAEMEPHRIALQCIQKQLQEANAELTKERKTE